MSRIRKEGERVGEDTGYRFDDEERGDDGECGREGTPMAFACSSEAGAVVVIVAHYDSGP